MFPLVLYSSLYLPFTHTRTRTHTNTTLGIKERLVNKEDCWESLAKVVTQTLRVTIPLEVGGPNAWTMITIPARSGPI